MRPFRFASFALSLALLLAAQVGCSSSTGAGDGAGGKGETGGASASGGSGGSGSGGVAATGGSAAQGGSVGSGGKGSGGSVASGGSTGSGGVTSSGGTSAAGGAAGGSTVGKDAAAGGAAGGSDGGGAGGAKDAAADGKADTRGTGGASTGGTTTTSTVSDGGTSGSGGAGGAGGGTGSTGPVYNPDFKEFYGEDCTVADPKDVSISELPDLFKMLDGSTMSKKSEWRCRRAELKKIVEKYIHGAKPGTPEKVTGTVSKSSISVKVEHKGKTISFSVTVTLPPGATGPVPAIIGVGGSNLSKSILDAEGVAVINYTNHNTISSETSRTGLFTDIYGSTGISAQIGWAWGASRIIDVLVAERDAGRNDIIDPTAIGVTGCSRNGKGAFTVGAFDERIALGIPQESGTCGVSALRIVATGPTGPNGKAAESISSATTSAGPGWFGTVFTSYANKLNAIPSDMHAMVAMHAPRGLLVLDNSRIGELCSTCQHAASVAGGHMYEALGLAKNIEYNGGNPTDPHDHCTFYAASQGEPLKRAIRAFLTKKAAPDGRIEPAAVTKTDLAKWVPWKAATLADDVSWSSPPLTKGP